MIRHFPGTATERRQALCLAALVAFFSFLLAGCPPKTALFDAGVAGTIVAQSNSRAVVLATVYLVDDGGRVVADSTTRSNQAGRFRISAPAGAWHLVATDNSGGAAFRDVTIADGQLLDLGLLAMSPCVGGDSPNGAVYQSCPSPPAIAPPPASFSVDTFAADRVEATLYSTQSPSSAQGTTQELFLTANDDVNHLSLSVWIPSSSPYFTPGQYAPQTDASDPYPAGPAEFSVTLAWTNPDTGAQSFYILASGSLVVEALDPRLGGLVKMALSGATFDWGEAGPALDATHTISIVATDPAIAATLSASAETTGEGTVAGPPNGTPTPSAAPQPTPGAPVSLGTVPAGSVYVYASPDGLNVYTYHDLGGGAYLALSLSVPQAWDAAGSYAVSNQVQGPSSGWTLQMYGDATYSPDGATAWTYVLSSAGFAVQQSSSSPSHDFIGQLTNAKFFYLDGGTSGDASRPLTFVDSGTLSGTLSSPDGARTGIRPWHDIPGL